MAFYVRLMHFFSFLLEFYNLHDKQILFVGGGGGGGGVHLFKFQLASHLNLGGGGEHPPLSPSSSN